MVALGKRLVGRKLIYYINFIAGIAIFFFGYDQGVMGGVNTSPDYVETMKLGYSVYEGPSEGWAVVITEPTRQGGIVSIYYLGTLIGCLIAGSVGDRVGRIKTMFIGGLWVLLGATLQCSAQNIAWMLCARIINGIGTGFLNAIVPVWSAEVASYTSRGAFIAMEFTLNIFGVVVAYWLEFGLSFVDSGLSQVRWRFPLAFQIVPMLVFMAFIFTMPESPRWLIKAGRTDEALVILGRLRADGNSEDAEVVREYEDIVEVVALERKTSSRNTYWAMFWGIGEGDLHIARRVQLNIWLQIVQEWVGIAAITVYAPTLFAQAGYGARKSQWLSGLNDVTYMLATLFAAYTIDRWGRRIGLYWGAVAQGIALFLGGAMGHFVTTDPANASKYGAGGAFSLFLYTAVFGATWLTIPWVYPTETFPLEVRAKGMAWGVVGWSLGNGWLTLINPVLFDRIGSNTLFVFAAINFAAIPMVWAFYPETANRTLEEIDLLFASKSWFAWDAEKNFAKLKTENHHLPHTSVTEKGPTVRSSEDKEEIEKEEA